MPQRRQLFKSSTASLVLLAAALGVLAVMPSRRRKVRVAPRRLAASLAFATLFFEGAAFSAGAGNTVAQLLEPGDESALMAPESATTSTEEDPAADSEASRRVGGPTDDAEEAPATEAPPAEAPPAEQPEPPAEATPALPAESSDSAPEDDANAWQAAPAAPTASDDTTSTHASTPKSDTLIARTKPSKWAIRQNAFRRSAPPVLAPRPLMNGELDDKDPEVDEPGVSATVWLHRRLPDPTPPARRLKPSFAGQLSRTFARAASVAQPPRPRRPSARSATGWRSWAHGATRGRLCSHWRARRHSRIARSHFSATTARSGSGRSSRASRRPSRRSRSAFSSTSGSPSTRAAASTSRPVA